MSYIVSCVLLFLNDYSNEAQSLSSYLSGIFPLHLDNRRDYILYKSITINGINYYQVAFYSALESETLRNETYNIMLSNKQYCWQGDNAENQYVKKFDSGSPTFGSPIYNIVDDVWGMDC